MLINGTNIKRALVAGTMLSAKISFVKVPWISVSRLAFVWLTVAGDAIACSCWAVCSTTCWLGELSALSANSVALSGPCTLSVTTV